MRIVKGANLVVMFLLELGVIAGAATWGFTLDGSLLLRVVAGLVGPALFIYMWALFGAAANARFPLRGRWRLALELIWFGGGALAWGVAVGPVPGGAFFAVWALNALIRYLGDGTLAAEPAAAPQRS
ncbi:YrdB family protein [Nocardia sp. NPDC048505]|uniref:YrdB family protein n=1 Tax=unclassified Nocardia TaxID=2637762 RepID=UPI0034026260